MLTTNTRTHQTGKEAHAVEVACIKHTMNIPLYQVDAFTDKVFAGNPAAVCPLENWLPDDVLQNIARENNLAETAFFVRHDDAHELRWFTPTVEVALCGHATLASAFVLFNFLDHNDDTIRFESRQSGTLIVERQDNLLVLDFPARVAMPCAAPRALIDGLGVTPREVLRAFDYLAVFDSEDEVRALTPNAELLKELHPASVIVTAKGDTVDFVSRYFAPSYGIPEDPVTGAAHCTLIPYWAGRLSKTKLHARQISVRGGELFCEYLDDRVKIGGYAVPYMRGEIFV
ncbi:MAG: PhzF family phenazine biosynthesis protein [Pyrinomonadaceae bacterium]